jgi:hypothetical protein
MKTDLLKVGLRQQAIYIANDAIVGKLNRSIDETTSVFIANCAQLGFTFSEPLLDQLNAINPKAKLLILKTLKEIRGVHKNWTPLVKQWDIPTGESRLDHAITYLSNIFKSKRGTTLTCGHFIPDNTFPLHRYNGCPYCGTPFEMEALSYEATKNDLTILDLWTDEDLQKQFKALLQSSIVLDATQIDSLKILLTNFDLPVDVMVKMKETLMLVIDVLVAAGKASRANVLFKSPTDILRYVWYKQTGFLQIIEPKTIIKRAAANAGHSWIGADKSAIVKVKTKSGLKLKFNRKTCRMYADWLNELEMDVEKQCELMHAKRGMWVRLIRALRLAELSKRKGYAQLAQLLDMFYNKEYEVWSADFEHYKFKLEGEKCFAMLKSRPGLFARSLFSTMLWFGAEETLKHFRLIMDKVSPRLLMTLNMYADLYFDKSGSRVVKPLGGTNKKIPMNQLLEIYSEKDLNKMVNGVRRLTKEQIAMRFEAMGITSTSIYIAPELYGIPVSVGDRSEYIQDLPAAVIGTRFKMEGDKVRLFMQWGNGLKAQHLDMDLRSLLINSDGM